jgi:hypothetical protein
MWGESKPEAVFLDVAKAVAPYVHPPRASVDRGVPPMCKTPVHYCHLRGPRWNPCEVTAAIMP